MNEITHLQPGDLILIVAPAKAIEQDFVYYAKELLEQKGFKVELSTNCLNTHFYFSGTDEQRAADFQWAIDHPEAKAIICARGGYGCIRILDRIQWASQLRNPKWIVGFSDVTVFHQYMQTMHVPSIHATMPLNFKSNSHAAIETLVNALHGNTNTIHVPSNKFNKLGKTTGELIGGNLSIVYSLLGTELQPTFTNKILFLEDVGEQLYTLDRMFFSLKKAGILDTISGLIIGGMTDIKDTTAITVGLDIYEIVLQHFPYRNIPICFDFPAGHIDDNQALIFGRNATLEVTEENAVLKQ